MVPATRPASEIKMRIVTSEYWFHGAPAGLAAWNGAMPPASRPIAWTQ
jgi:hypothetical protein